MFPHPPAYIQNALKLLLLFFSLTTVGQSKGSPCQHDGKDHQHGHYPLPSSVQQTNPLNIDFLHILIVKPRPHHPHLSQDVSGARPSVDAGLAEPSLLLLHHQRLRPARSSGKLHLKHFLNFFLSAVFRLSDISVDCLNFLPTTLPGSTQVPVCCQKSAYWRLHWTRPPALRRSGKIWSAPDSRQLDFCHNTTGGPNLQ